MALPRLTLLALFTLSLGLNAWSGPLAPLPELEDLLSRPISRMILAQTREGTEVNRLLRSLTGEERVNFARELAPRLRNAEREVRSRLSGEEGSDEAMTELSASATANFALRPAAEGGTAAWKFVSDLPAPSTYSGNRESFLTQGEASSTASSIGVDFSRRDLSKIGMAGEDLRLTRWVGATLGDLRAADLRAADLRGAQLTPSTQLDGAQYDQFTRLPFSTTEAHARGMIYEPSRPPEGFASVDVQAAEERAARAVAKPPEGAYQVPARALKDLPRLSPATAEGMDLFDAPKRVQARGKQWMRFEAGSLRADNPDPVIRDLVRELVEDGGQARRLVFVNPYTGAILPNEPGAYFVLDGKTPVIAVGSRATPPIIFHEREHLRDWMKVYRGFLAQGKTEEEAFKLAQQERMTTSYKVMTERHAVTAQLRAQRALDEAAGVSISDRRYRFENPYFAATVTYPECEGIRRIFATRTLAEISADPGLRAEAEVFGRRIVRNALIARRNWYFNLGMKEAADVTREELFYGVIAGNASRYAEDGSLREVQAFFNELLPSEIAKLPDDEFKTQIAEEIQLPPRS